MTKLSKYSASSLRLFSNHCPAALGFYEDNVVADRDAFAAGTAAHAVLQELGERARAGYDDNDRDANDAAQRVAYALTTKGRSYRGRPEPPLPPDAVREGRDLALSWYYAHGVSSTALYEVELAMNAGGKAVPSEFHNVRYSAILDVLDLTTVGDEESEARAAIITEYKTAWPTGADELNTIQLRGQAVLVAAHYDVDVIVRRVVNLRTRAQYTDHLWIEESREQLDVWRRDLLALCDAAEATRAARPGAGCGGCPYAAACPHAWSVLMLDGDSDAATRFAVADGVRTALGDVCRSQAADRPLPVPGGAVGYFGQPTREPLSESYRSLALAWCSVPESAEERWMIQHAELLGLLAALKLSKTNIEAAAKALHPGKAGQAARDDLIELCTEPAIRRVFKVMKGASDDDES